MLNLMINAFCLLGFVFASVLIVISLILGLALIVASVGKIVDIWKDDGKKKDL